MKKTLIFTDLDGTLLDEQDYSHTAALPALALVEKCHTPLILCSSKTRAEILACRSALNNRHPFISENGGGIFIPQGYFSFPVEMDTVAGYHTISLGTPYVEIRRQFVRLREECGVPVRGFGDMRIAEVAALTGLSLQQAELARQRDFDEPFVFDGAPDEDFLKAIESAGLHWTQGRIFHILGNHDKGRAVMLLKAFYELEYGGIASIGLGDGYNDLPMLQAVDHPVLIRCRDGHLDPRIELPGLIRTHASGPGGWNEALFQILPNHKDAPYAQAPRPSAILGELFGAAIAAVDPRQAVLNHVTIHGSQLQAGGETYDLSTFQRILVCGAGKATARMAQAIETLLGGRISAGQIVVKSGHGPPLDIIEQVEAAHPVPDQAGEAGTRRILEMLHEADQHTLVICLLSGGASALLVAPAQGLSLADKQATTGLLLKSGATIAELNAVRKHLSAVKGGRLAKAAYPATVLSLVLSDVIGNPLDVIASGPTAMDSTTFADAWSVLEKYRLTEAIPARVAEHLQQGMAGLVPETMKDCDAGMRNTRNVIVGDITMALAAAQLKAHSLGLNAEIVTAALHGEARAAAGVLAQRARAEYAAMQDGERRCLLFGGETTVTVTGSGKGGRNQELALAFALEIEGQPGITLLCAGTDGNDGPTDAAGARVDGNTTTLARCAGIEPADALAANDSYAFFQRLDTWAQTNSHFITGPTGTNVMDIQIVLLEKSPKLE